MVSKYFECISVDGKYSIAKIGWLILAIVCVAGFAWLIGLTLISENDEMKNNELGKYRHAQIQQNLLLYNKICFYTI